MVLAGTHTVNPAGSPSVTRGDGQPTAVADDEFDRFRDLAAKLVGVPKPELDAQRDGHTV